MLTSHECLNLTDLFILLNWLLELGLEIRYLWGQQLLFMIISEVFIRTKSPCAWLYIDQEFIRCEDWKSKCFIHYICQLYIVDNQQTNIELINKNLRLLWLCNAGQKGIDPYPFLFEHANVECNGLWPSFYDRIAIELRHLQEGFDVHLKRAGDFLEGLLGYWRWWSGSGCHTDD